MRSVLSLQSGANLFIEGRNSSFRDRLLGTLHAEVEAGDYTNALNFCLRFAAPWSFAHQVALLDKMDHLWESLKISADDEVLLQAFLRYSIGRGHKWLIRTQHNTKNGLSIASVPFCSRWRSKHTPAFHRLLFSYEHLNNHPERYQYTSTYFQRCNQFNIRVQLFVQVGTLLNEFTTPHGMRLVVRHLLDHWPEDIARQLIRVCLMRYAPTPDFQHVAKYFDYVPFAYLMQMLGIHYAPIQAPYAAYAALFTLFFCNFLCVRPAPPTPQHLASSVHCEYRRLTLIVDGRTKHFFGLLERLPFELYHNIIRCLCKRDVETYVTDEENVWLHLIGVHEYRRDINGLSHKELHDDLERLIAISHGKYRMASVPTHLGASR